MTRENARRLGLMGGTFNPIHYGHLLAAESAREMLGLYQILFIPNRYPPHKRPEDIAIPEDRFVMTVLATMDHPQFRVSRLEIDRPGPSYALDTLRLLREEYPAEDLYFITGIDAVLDMPSWHEAGALMELAHFVAVTRPGYRVDELRWALTEERLKKVSIVEVATLHISSSEIRQRVRDRLSIRYLTPQTVVDFINHYALYREEEIAAASTGKRAYGPGGSS
jgi:nicotinate-nucleotide adenylyltransferase